MTGYDLTQQRHAEIIALLRETDLSYNALSERFGLSPWRVREIARRHGLDLSHRANNTHNEAAARAALEWLARRHEALPPSYRAMAEKYQPSRRNGEQRLTRSMVAGYVSRLRKKELMPDD